MQSRIAAPLVALAFGALSAGTALAETPGPTGPRLPPIIYRGANLPPPSRSKPVPLVIALHGSSMSPASMEQISGLNQLADRYGFVVAYLGSQTPPRPAWTLSNLTTNLAYISQEIKQLTASEKLDHSRVYVTGFSAGAAMTFFVGCDLSSQVAAIGPVGTTSRWQDPCKLSRPVSIIHIIGSTELGGAAVTGTPILMPASAVASRWESLDGCSSAPSHASQYFTVTEDTWARCNDASAAASYVIQGGNHVWPPAAGADRYLDAARTIWGFFAAHPAMSATAPSVSVASVRIRHSQTQRWVRIAIRLRENAVVLRATLSYRSRRVAYRVFRLSRGQALDSLSIRKTAPAGRYRLTLVFTDGYGRHTTIVRIVTMSTLPAP